MKLLYVIDKNREIVIYKFHLYINIQFTNITKSLHFGYSIFEFRLFFLFILRDIS